MFSTDTTQQIAQQHIAELHANAAQARLVKQARSSRRANRTRRSLFTVFRSRPTTTVTAQPICTD